VFDKVKRKERERETVVTQKRKKKKFGSSHRKVDAIDEKRESS
jgi:hypothetical protein